MTKVFSLKNTKKNKLFKIYTQKFSIDVFLWNIKFYILTNRLIQFKIIKEIYMGLKKEKPLKYSTKCFQPKLTR